MREEQIPARRTFTVGTRCDTISIVKADPCCHAKTNSNMSSKLERCRYYLGTAQIQLLHLRYRASSTEPDDCISCCTSDLEHNLPALITSAEYWDCLAGAGVSPNALYAVGKAPRLALPSGVELLCLHGRFRLDAAKRDGSQSQEDWWLVDLYSAGKSVVVLSTAGC